MKKTHLVSIFIASLILISFFYFKSESDPVSKVRGSDTKKISRQEKQKKRLMNKLAKKKKTSPDVNLAIQDNSNHTPNVIRVPSSGKNKKVITQRHPSAKEQAKHYEGALTSYFAEDTVKLLGKDFRISENLIAKPIRKLGSTRVLYRLGSYGIVEEQIEEPLKQHHQYRVLYDLSKKRYVILTGKIFVRFENEVTENELRSEYQLKLQETISHLRFSVTTPIEGVSLVNVEEILKNHLNVETFEIEILEDGIHEK